MSVAVSATIGALTIDSGGAYKKGIDAVLARFDRDAAVRLEMAKLVAARLEGLPKGFPMTVSWEPPKSEHLCTANEGGRVVYFLINGGVHIQIPLSSRPPA